MHTLLRILLLDDIVLRQVDIVVSDLVAATSVAPAGEHMLHTVPVFEAAADGEPSRGLSIQSFDFIVLVNVCWVLTRTDGACGTNHLGVLVLPADDVRRRRGIHLVIKVIFIGLRDLLQLSDQLDLDLVILFSQKLAEALGFVVVEEDERDYSFLHAHYVEILDLAVVEAQESFDFVELVEVLDAVHHKLVEASGREVGQILRNLVQLLRLVLRSEQCLGF